MIKVRRFGAGGRRALNAVFGVEEKWGKGRSFVEQDKASAVQCRGSAVFSNILTPFPPLESILVGQLHITAKSASERVVTRLQFNGFRHARRPVRAMIGPAIAVASLAVLGRFIGLRISLTESAANSLAPACQPTSHRKASLAVTCGKAIVQAEPSRSPR